MRLFNNWINGDCLKELKKMDSETVDLVVTSPPYHNLRVYSNDPCDLSNCESYEEYYYLLGLVIAECERVLKPGGKFVIQFEDYNYTIGRDNKMGQESLTGDINKIFLDNGFALWTKAFWRKYSAQRAMLAQGNLYYRNMKARDTILAANVGFVYVYKKSGDCELIKASDITLAEWADWADGVWNISNSGIGHTTPFAEELVKRCIKLNLESDVIHGNREKWYEESLIEPLMDEFWFNDLGLCGCNCPEDTKEAIRKYLHIRKDFHDKELTYEGAVRRYRTDLGIDEHSQVQHGVLQFMMYVLDKEGYTDHGGSVGGCWLTKKGEMFMDVLDAWYKREHSEN